MGFYESNEESERPILQEVLNKSICKMSLENTPIGLISIFLRGNEFTIIYQTQHKKC